ncbi:hypothetical protein [Porphyrobacter sp. AAP82]|uniref:hypothetical protein n=1 Tax=Porphyrobacter sp. AAP82 TaxID=1248917 RepID=UPI0004776097|nr:hypothetical protein [Porphyrobacter sp. AAP82]
MFSVRMKARLGALALAGAALALPAAAMAGVVVKSTGPSATRYPVGAKIDDNATITLKPGDVVTVLTAQGTRVIKGAGTFRIGDRPQVAADRFASLTRKRAATRVRTGAVRGDLEGNPTNPSLWYVDVTRSGTVCLYDLASVRLWRPGAPDTITYRMFNRENGAAVDVTFDETVTVAALDPIRLPIVEGATYSITGPDNSTSAQVSFVLLEGDFEAPDALAAALLDKGCTVQVDMLAAGLDDEAAASGG